MYTRGGRGDTDFIQGESRGTDKKAAKNGVLDKATAIKVKISGDGTNIGKRLKLENATYTNYFE